MEEIESAVCTGIHEERKLLFTDGPVSYTHLEH